MSSGGYRLFAQAGWGSAIAEAALTLAALPFEIESVDMRGGPAARAMLVAVNPLGEVPTLILPGGEVMTESAAIILHIADLVPHAGLVPQGKGMRRAIFLRWLAFLVATVYPTFTYGDTPSRWVPRPDAQDALKASTDAARNRAWTLLEAALTPSPWAVGEFSALDIYIAVMMHWRPGKDWFAANAPKLHKIALATLALPRLEEVWRRNGFIAP